MILQEAPQSLAQHLTKIRFLEGQKEQLQDHIKGLEYSLLLNKTALKQFSNLLNNKYPDSKVSQSLISSISNLQKQKDIIKQQNTKLKYQIQSLKCEQESDQQYASVMKSYEQKILELRRIIQDKQYAIQQKQTVRNQKMNIHEDVFPRYDLVNMQIKAEQTLRLTKILTNQNNKLYNQIKCICQDLQYTDINLSDLEAIKKNSDKIIALKVKIEKIKDYFKNLEQKRVLMRSSIQNHKISFNDVKENIYQQRSSSKNKGYNIQLVASSLRQLLFKQKKNNEILKKQLEQYSNKIKQLRTTNKLLTQSNINYQTKRGLIKEQLRMYKVKYTELMNLVISTRDKTNSKQILKQMRKKQEPNFSTKQKHSFKKQKNKNIQLITAKQQSEKEWNNSLLRHTDIYKYQFKRSKSCILDDIFVQHINNYKKQQQQQQQTEVNNSNLILNQSYNQPFSINFSVIHPN